MVEGCLVPRAARLFEVLVRSIERSPHAHPLRLRSLELPLDRNHLLLSNSQSLLGSSQRLPVHTGLCPPRLERHLCVGPGSGSGLYLLIADVTV